jgi:hypothetical protein
MTTKTKKTKKTKKLPDNNQDLITIILLCDNPGYRMKSYGPISLIDLTTEKLIDYQIKSIKSVFKNFEIILCLGFDCEKVCRYVKSKYKDTIRIVENQIYSTTNSCESLRLCLNNTCNDKIVVCDGSLLLDKGALSLIDTTRSCTLIEFDPNDTLEIGLNIDAKNIAQFFSFGAKFIWSEILYLAGKDIIESLRRILSTANSKTKFTFEAINELITMKYEIKTINNKKSLYKLNNIKTYHNIKDIMQ